jgi:hypothetical protein
MKHLFALLVVSALIAAPAQAQTPKPRPERPYRGLFGGGVGNAEQILKLNVSFSSGYDDDVTAGEQGGPGNPRSDSPASVFSRGAAALSYSLIRTKISFQATGTAATSYVPGALQNLVTSYSSSFGTSIKASSRTTLSAGMTVSRQPLYFYQPTFTQVFDLIFGETVLYDQNVLTIKQRRTMTTSSAGVTHNLTKRLTANASAGYESSETTDHVSDYGSRSLNGGLAYAVGKGLSMRAGYGVRNGEYDSPGEAPRAIRTQTIDGGVDYNKSLSFSRKTTLSFSSGTSVLNDGSQSNFLVTGHVNLGREIGRTWNANAGYYRQVSYSDVVHDPILSDSGTVSVSGLVSHRVQLTAALGLSTGVVGFAVGGNDFRTYYGSISAQYDLTRHLALSFRYARYRYQFDSGVSLTPGVPSRSDRQMVSASVEFWEPLFYRARRGNASR